MRITQVEYRMLVSHGEYNNTTIGATALLYEDETPEAGLATLAEWVQGQVTERITNTHAQARLREELWALESQVSHKGRQLAQMREEWATARRVLARHGVVVEDAEAAVLETAPVATEAVAEGEFTGDIPF